MAVLVALIRGFVRRQTDAIGNFYVDLTRGTLYILLPLSLLLAVVLDVAGRGAELLRRIATRRARRAHRRAADGKRCTEQTIPLGPAASQIAIKQLGTNGGGFFNVNSAHPFENPTPLSQLPARCCRSC